MMLSIETWWHSLLVNNWFFKKSNTRIRDFFLMGFFLVGFRVNLTGSFPKLKDSTPRSKNVGFGKWNRSKITSFSRIGPRTTQARPQQIRDPQDGKQSCDRDQKIKAGWRRARKKVARNTRAQESSTNQDQAAAALGAHRTGPAAARPQPGAVNTEKTMRSNWWPSATTRPWPKRICW